MAEKAGTAVQTAMPMTKAILKNPIFDNSRGAPVERGQVRGTEETLEYKDPRGDVFKPAVRLAHIRQRLIEQYPPSRYIYTKEKGYDETDVTAFLEKDAAFSGDREHRAPTLFQIYPTDDSGQRGPLEFMKYEGRIVLDSFDHGIRDFPGILPMCLSSELAGHDIMHYMRQDKNISLYDMIARQPNGYHEQNGLGIVKWHKGPPRYGTVGMRATRFRLHAGLLTWKNRMGSDTRNAKILSFIPAQCKDPRVNSTKAFRDLTQEEMMAVANILKGSAPSRAQKKKRNKQDTNGDPGNDEPPGFADMSNNMEDAPGETDHESDRPLARRTRNGRTSVIRKTPKKTRGRPQKAKRVVRTATATSPAHNVSVVVDNSAFNNFQQPINRQITRVPSTNYRYISQEESNLIGHNDPVLARFASAAINRRQTMKIAPAQSTIDSSLDFRYIVPNAFPATVEDNIAALQDALELTRVDFFYKTGWHPPPSLKAEHQDETYTRQYQALQMVFSQFWYGNRNSGICPKLFMFGKWTGGFRGWKVESEEEQRLYTLGIEYQREKEQEAIRE